jgi:hypothetical protein
MSFNLSSIPQVDGEDDWKAGMKKGAMKIAP